VSALLLAAVGAGAGLAQARLLAAAARGRGVPGGFGLRLGLVAAALLFALSAGQLPAAALGWMSGFALGGVGAARALR
jgi:hypothetical protein